MAEIYYIPEVLFGALKEKLRTQEAVTDDDISPLTSPMTAEDDAIMIPVDMRGIGHEFEDVDDLPAELGLKGTVEAFIRAREYFEANKDGEAEEDRAKPIS